MSFDWSDYLSLARALSLAPNVPGPEEACLRSAMSRAYYAAFCAARNFARENDDLTQLPAGTAHQALIQHFQSSQDRDRRKLGTWLGRLRDNRRMADYDDRIAGDLRSYAQSSVAQATNLLDKLGAL